MNDVQGEKYIKSSGMMMFIVCFFLMQYLVGCASKQNSQQVNTNIARSDLEKWASDEWEQEDFAFEDIEGSAKEEKIADPLEPMNRAFFVFNDKLYFWVLKPIAQVYSFILPEDVRVCFKNATYNLLMPIRFTNNLLQGKFRNSGIELSRFLINSTAGIYGLADAAKLEFGIEPRDEDFGQTLGKYGVGEGLYIHWPIFGPSNVRDTFGLAGDSFLNPFSYILSYDNWSGASIQTGFRINQTSLTLGTYEQLKEASFDPYVAVRDAYKQNRDSKIKDKDLLQGGLN